MGSKSVSKSICGWGYITNTMAQTANTAITAGFLHNDGPELSFVAVFVVVFVVALLVVFDFDDDDDDDDGDGFFFSVAAPAAGVLFLPLVSLTPCFFAIADYFSFAFYRTKYQYNFPRVATG